MPTPDEQILTNEQIAEIEARQVTDHHLKSGAYIGCYILLSTSERNALCATVKQLRMESDQLRASWEASEQQSAAQLNEVYQQRFDLQSQLEQLRAENERLTAIWCLCSHLKTSHDFFDDHDECHECPSDGPPSSCSEFRPDISRRERREL